jgi:hypothetical protein
MVSTVSPYHGAQVTRPCKRILLVLLTGLPRLSRHPIAKAAGVRGSRARLILAMLERNGWATSTPEDERGRRFYTLTDDGRRWAFDAIGLGLNAREER